MGRSDDAASEENLDTGIREPELTTIDGYTDLPTQGVDDPAYREAVLADGVEPPIADGTDLRDLPAGTYTGPDHQDADVLKLGWDEQTHTLSPDGTDAMPPEVREHAERVLQDLSERPEVVELLAQAQRTLREAPDGAEGELSGPDTIDGGGLSAILAAMGGVPVSDEQIAELFGNSPLGAMAAERLLAGGMTRPAFTSDDVIEADELGVGLAVTGGGDVGIAITLHAEGERAMTRLLDPYRALKLINALSEAATRALDQQMQPLVVKDEAANAAPTVAEQLDTEE